MPTPLASALLGAAVAFIGTYLLQRGQFRRYDLDGVRERLGLTRALRADLYVSKLTVELWIRDGQLTCGTNLAAALWASHGHRLVAALKPVPAEVMFDAFSRFNSVNGILSATQRPGGHLPLKDGALTSDHLQGLMDKIGMAIEVLDKLEGEYEGKELRLRFPFRSHLPQGAWLALPK